MNQTAYDLLIPTLSYSNLPVILRTRLTNVGLAGLATGSVLAVSRAAPIPGYALSTGLNFGLLGGTFTGLRYLGRRRRLMNDASDGQIVGTSGLCGCTTGALYNLLFRGRRGLLGAVLLYGGLGAAGESANLAVRSYLSSAGTLHVKDTQDRTTGPVPEGDKSVWRRLKESSPLRSIPNDEFERLMVDKITSLDEQISLVDKEIQAARQATSTR